MHIRLIAVGDRQPSWVDTAFGDYVDRLPKAWRFALHSIPVAKRKSGGAPVGLAAEEQKLLAAVRPDDRMVLLDEKGEQMASRELATRLQGWLAAGRDLCFVIGGPDGVANAIRQRADFCWSLSNLTLPHGLVRVLLAEQLYRAWSIDSGHPYHRE